MPIEHGLDLSSMWVDGCPSQIGVLSALLEHVSGPVIEFGSGFYSTPLFMAAGLRNKVVIVEPDPKWRSFFQRAFPNKLATWKVMTSNGPRPNVQPTDMDQTFPDRWGMAFVDSRPSIERARIIRALAPCCDYIVVHDTEESRAHLYPGVADELAMFRYRLDVNAYTPRTTIVSDSEPMVWLCRLTGGSFTGLDSEMIERNHKV